MRAYRKRSWADLAVNMTPLIDVVFLIIIFFIIMINFSEIHIKNIILPKADESHDSIIGKQFILPIIIKSEKEIYLDRTLTPLKEMSHAIDAKKNQSNIRVIQIHADKDVPYAVVKEVLHKLSSAGVGKLEFLTIKDSPEPL